MTTNQIVNSIRISLPGMAVTGGVGALIGSFIGGAPWIIGMTAVGAAVGLIVWTLGGRRFFLFVMVGGLLGALLAIFISGLESAILGGATGGAMGGFVGVNMSMLKPRRPS